MSSRWPLVLATCWLAASCQLLSGGADLVVDSGTPSQGGGGSSSGGTGGSSVASGGMGGSGGATSQGGGGSGGGLGAPAPCVMSVDEIGAALWGSPAGHLAAHDISPHPDGGCVVVGDFEGDVPSLGLSSASGVTEAFVLRIDGEGDIAWAKAIRSTLAGPAYTSAHHVGMADSTIYVAGQDANNGFVATIDTAQVDNEVAPWWAELTGTLARINDMLVVADGIWIAGSCTDTIAYEDFAIGSDDSIPCSSGSHVGFLIKLSTTAAPAYKYLFSATSTANVHIYALAIRNDLLAVVGDFGGGKLSFGAVEATPTDIISGAGTGAHGFVVSVDPVSGGVGAVPVSATGPTEVTAVAFVADNAVLVGGAFQQSLSLGNPVVTIAANGTHGFLAEYNVTSAAATYVDGSLVHLGQPAVSASVSVTDVAVRNEMTRQVVVAGKFQGTMLAGLAASSTNPYVLSADVNTEVPNVTPLLQVLAESTDTRFGIGLRLGADDRIYLATQIDEPGEIEDFDPVSANYPLALSSTPASEHGLAMTFGFP